MKRVPFEWIYKKDEQGRWYYHEFVRLDDRYIYEQKEDNYELLSLGFDRMLLEEIKDIIGKSRNEFNVSFELKEELNIHRTKFNLGDILNIRIQYYTYEEY